MQILPRNIISSGFRLYPFHNTACHFTFHDCLVKTFGKRVPRVPLETSQSCLSSISSLRRPSTSPSLLLFIQPLPDVPGKAPTWTTATLQLVPVLNLSATCGLQILSTTIHPGLSPVMNHWLSMLRNSLCSYRSRRFGNAQTGNPPTSLLLQENFEAEPHRLTS